MARRTASDARRIRDPALGYNYNMRFKDIPGSPNADLNLLSIKILTTEVPANINESFEIMFGGIPRKFVGRKAPSQTISFEIVECTDYEVFRMFEDWANLPMDHDNYGHLQSDYVTDCVIEAYSQHQRPNDAPMNAVTLTDCFIEEFGPVPYDSSNTAEIRIPVTMSYYYQYANVLAGSGELGDPYAESGTGSRRTGGRGARGGLDPRRTTGNRNTGGRGSNRPRPSSSSLGAGVPNRV